MFVRKSKQFKIMKKILVLILTFSLLFSFNANASKNVISNDFEVKSKVFDQKNNRKIKTIQKILNTKIGKWVLKKAIKKLQKKALNPKNSKIDPPSALAILLIIGLILLLGIIFLKILGSFLLIIGLVLLIGYFVFLAIFNFDNWRRTVS